MKLKHHLAEIFLGKSISPGSPLNDLAVYQAFIVGWDACRERYIALHNPHMLKTDIDSYLLEKNRIQSIGEEEVEI